jgi:hypothetical protein
MHLLLRPLPGALLVTPAFLLFLFLAAALGADPLLLPPLSSGGAGPRSLVRPTPHEPERTRDFETDRPDITEAARTVPAGHFQAEISVFDFARDNDGEGETESQLWGNLNLKLGVRDNVDLQFVFDAFGEERRVDDGGTSTREGFGDLTTRLKVNLWGNDGGRTAFALFPYVKFPTGTARSNDRAEGGLILPFSVDLNDRHSLGLMLQPDLIFEEISGGRDLEVLHSVALGTALGARWGNYVEYAGITGSVYRALFSGGFTFSPRDALQYDLGVRLGLNDAAEDFGIFAGVSFRL